MDIRIQRVIDELDKARQELVNVPKNTLTYADINIWHTKWIPTFLKAETLSGRNVTWLTAIILQGYTAEKDVEVLNILRMEIVEELGHTMTLIDSKVKIRSILEEYIAKVQDRKLWALLNEFNSIKDIAPNHAAIGFRTIISLLLQQKANQVDSQSDLATRPDLQCGKVIKDAIDTHIFGIGSGEERLLKNLLTTVQKDIFDTVAHKSGDVHVVNKDDLNAAVDILTRLLPSII